MVGRAPVSTDRVAFEDLGDDDGSRWEAAARLYRSSLKRFFANRVNNPADVGDLVQKVFVRVIQRSGGAPIEHVQQYLFQVAASVLNDEYRRARVRQQDAHECYDEAVHGRHCELSPERALLAEEAAQRVAAAVRRMPETMRDVYILRVHRECEYAVIARELGISMRGAQRHMARALKHLEDVLNKDQPKNEPW